jgi:hypothetical protein
VPATTLSNLVISNATDEGADLDWSYDEAPPVGEVKLQYRDVTGGVIGSWIDYSSSPLAAGTEAETLAGLSAGNQYEVRLVLIDGSAVEYGTVLTGIFATTGGKISSLSVSSVTASTAKLNWTNTDASHGVLVEIRVSGATLWQTYTTLAATSNRIGLVGLLPVTDYEVRVSIGGGDGAGGAALTDSFTTLAVSVILDPPLYAGVFWDVDQVTSAITPGLYGVKLFNHPANPMPHSLAIQEAVETAVGSGLPGSFAEIAVVPAVSGGPTYWTAIAPNDGKWRWLRALSRLAGYTDSVVTESLPAKPWSVQPQPPVGGGVPNILQITATGLAAGGQATGFSAFADGAEIYKMISTNSKKCRLRFHKTEAGRDADLPRPDSDQTWPTSLLFDGQFTAAESYTLDLDAQRVRILLAQLPDLYVHWSIDSEEVGTEDFAIDIYYFATGSGPLA